MSKATAASGLMIRMALYLEAPQDPARVDGADAPYTRIHGTLN
jgi:hypothetical protein